VLLLRRERLGESFEEAFKLRAAGNSILTVELDEKENSACAVGVSRYYQQQGRGRLAAKVMIPPPTKLLIVDAFAFAPFRPPQGRSSSSLRAPLAAS